MLDIPETQLLAVIASGFFLGWILVPRLIGHTIMFGLISGIVFYLIRFTVSITLHEQEGTNFAVGNGILSAMVMWFIFIGSMLVGDFVIRRQWDKVGD